MNPCPPRLLLAQGPQHPCFSELPLAGRCWRLLQGPGGNFAPVYLGWKVETHLQGACVCGVFMVVWAELESCSPRSPRTEWGHVHTSGKPCSQEPGGSLWRCPMGWALQSLGLSVRGGLGSAWASGSSLCPAAAAGISSMKCLLAALPLRRAPRPPRAAL